MWRFVKTSRSNKLAELSWSSGGEEDAVAPEGNGGLHAGPCHGLHVSATVESS